MGLLDLFRGAPKAEPRAARAITADGAGIAFYGLDDPALLDYLRTGSTSAAGIEVTVDRAMRNPAVFRSVNGVVADDLPSLRAIGFHYLRCFKRV